MATILEGARIMDGGDEGGSGQRPHAFDPGQPLTDLRLCGQLGDPGVGAGDLRLERTHPLLHVPQQLPTEVTQPMVRIFHDQGDRLAHAANALGYHEPILPQRPS